MLVETKVSYQNILFICIIFILGVQNHSLKGMNSDFLNGKLTVDELCQYVTIGTKWYKFGRLLKLDTSTDLDHIDQQYKDDDDSKVLKMFELWLSTSPNPTRREIIDTLLNPAINESVLAEKYMKVLTESEYRTSYI